MDIRQVQVPDYCRAPRYRPISLVCIHATRGAAAMDVQFAATVGYFRNVTDQGGWAPTADVCVGAAGEVAVFGRWLPPGDILSDFADWRTTHSTYAAGYGANLPPAGVSVDECALAIEIAQPAAKNARGQYEGTPGAVGPFTYEPFTQASIDALVEFLRPIVHEFAIPLVHLTSWEQLAWKAIPRGFIGHDETETGRKYGRTDPGPLFPWDEILSRLAQEEGEDDMRLIPLSDQEKVRLGAALGGEGGVFARHFADLVNTAPGDGYDVAIAEDPAADVVVFRLPKGTVTG